MENTMSTKNTEPTAAPALVAGHIDAAAPCPKCYKSEIPLHCACGGYIHKQFAGEHKVNLRVGTITLLNYLCSRCGDKFALRTYRK
jgi:hypothetical protein